MGDKDSIDSSCKSTKYGGKLSKQICTGIDMGENCYGKEATDIPKILQECQPEQNYGIDENGDNYFCRYEAGTGPWTMTNTRCEPKPS